MWDVHIKAKWWLLLTDVSVSIDVFEQSHFKKMQTHRQKSKFSIKKSHAVSRDFKWALCLCGNLCTVSTRKSRAAIYCHAAECNASSKGSKSLGRLLGFCENYGNAGEMDEQHFITINQRLLINKVHFLFSMIQGIIKRTLSLSFWLTNPSSLSGGGGALKGDAFFRP